MKVLKTKMRKVLILFLIFFISSCGSNRNWKTIQIENYAFDFPRNFQLTKERGIDSYVGHIDGNGVKIFYDVGRFSDNFGETLPEYIESGFWRNNLPYDFYKKGVNYPDGKPQVEVLEVRKAKSRDSLIGKGCDYVIKCLHDNIIYYKPLYLPEEIKYQKFKIDTIESQYRKLGFFKRDGTNFTGIYMKTVNDSNNRITTSLVAENLTKKQQKLVFKIYKTGRYRPK
jgi:hypothetical protein